MKAKILTLKGAESGTINLPEQFEEPLHPDLIKRAVLEIQAGKRQPYGASPKAGQRSSAKLSRRRRKYRGSYGKGISRVPRKIMWRRGLHFGFVGAFAPGIVGGRRAHPPKAEKIWTKEMNKKERRKAIRSAISAAINPSLVKENHSLPKNYPIIIQNSFEDLKKTREVKEVLLNLGLKEELERIAKKKIRAGKGKSRGRKYKIKQGPLLVISKHCSLEKAARNLQGIDISQLESLNAELLSSGIKPGRLVVWTKNSIDRLSNEKLFTNNPLIKKEEPKEVIEEKETKKEPKIKESIIKEPAKKQIKIKKSTKKVSKTHIKKTKK